jgi:hypothetical protein
MEDSTGPKIWPFGSIFNHFLELITLKNKQFLVVLLQSLLETVNLLIKVVK